MKFDFNRQYTTIAIYAVAVLVLTFLIATAFLNIGVFFGWLGRAIGYAKPFAFGLAIAFLLNPILRVFDDRLLPRLFKRKLKRSHSRAISIILTYIIVFTLITLFIALAFPQIIASIGSLVDNITAYVDILEDMYAQVMNYIRSDDQETAVEILISNVLARLVDTLDNLLDMASDYATALVGHIFSATQLITSTVFNFLLGIIASIYLLASREKLLAQFNKIMRAICSDRIYKLIIDIATDSNRIFNGFVVGRLVDSICVGILCFIGMSIFRFPYAVFISVIMGIVNIIPFFGSIFGGIVGFIIIYVESPVQSFWFAVFILLLQQFDGNYLGPKLVGNSIGIPTIWVLFSILFFGAMWGIPGMFIGAPFFAIIYSLVKRIVAFLLARKGESTNTKDYDSERNPLS